MLYVLGKLVCSIIILLFHPFDLKGANNIPEHGDAIIVSNHTSNWDPILIAMLTYREIHFLGKIELFKNPLLRWFFTTVKVIPVDRVKPTIKTMRESLRVLKDGGILGIFPEGTRVKDENERTKPQDGFIHFALRTHAPIIPIHISGSTKPWHKLKIVVGKPIELTEYYGKKLNKQKVLEIAENLMDKIYHLN